MRCRPHLLRLNCNSGKLAIIDTNGMFYLMDLDASDESSGQPGHQLQFERKDTWDMKWADDDPELFVVMEKTRMYVFGPNLEPEEPVLSSGYLASFSKLEIESVLLDEIMTDPSKLSRELIATFDTRALRACPYRWFWTSLQAPATT